MREYGFTDAYFTDPGEEPFENAQEERETYLRFIDMLCMISIYQNENKPDEAVDRVGTLLRDVDLMKALEPHEKKQFPAFNRVRFIFSKLLIRGKAYLRHTSGRKGWHPPPYSWTGPRSGKILYSRGGE